MFEVRLRRFLAGFGLAALLLAGASGCNTLEGFGEDLQNTGGAISDAADGEE